MNKQSVAVVGLGRVGSVFLERLLDREGVGVEVVAITEPRNTPGKELAVSKGIPVLNVDGLMELGDRIDVLFDLTGVPSVRKELREKLASSGNRHTIIANEAVARLIWALIAEGAKLPNVHGPAGY
jgi:predicted dinucleotide-utilizing enzyme